MRLFYALALPTRSTHSLYSLALCARSKCSLYALALHTHTVSLHSCCCYMHCAFTNLPLSSCHRPKEEEDEEEEPCNTLKKQVFLFRRPSTIQCLPVLFRSLSAIQSVRCCNVGCLSLRDMGVQRFFPTTCCAVCVLMHVRTCMCARMSVCMCVCTCGPEVHVCVCARACLCVRAHACLLVCTCMCARGRFVPGQADEGLRA